MTTIHHPTYRLLHRQKSEFELIDNHRIHQIWRLFSSSEFQKVAVARVFLPMKKSKIQTKAYFEGFNNLYYK